MLIQNQNVSPDHPTATVIDVKDLAISYRGHLAFHHSSVALNEGKLIGVIGPNGAGKSTFLKGIMGLIPVDSGVVLIFGQKVANVRKRIAYVPQRNDIDWDFPALVRDVVMMGRYPWQSWFKSTRKRDQKIVEECLAQVKLTELANRQIGNLSGGQQQRVFIARALDQGADLFLLDEPFVGVDMATEQIILQQLRQLRAAGKTVIVVHHDLNKAREYFDEILLINQRIIAYGPVEQMFTPERLQQTYGNQLTILSQDDKVTVINQ